MSDIIIDRVIVINENINCVYEGLTWKYDLQQTSENGRHSFLEGYDKGVKIVSMLVTVPMIIEYKKETLK